MAATCVASARRRCADIRGRDIGMVFQEPMTSLNPVLTIGRQITETLEQHQGADRATADRRALELLEMVGIADPGRRLQAISRISFPAACASG